MNKLFLSLIWLCCWAHATHVQAQSNEGREFWLGFMEHRDVAQNTMVVMISSRVNTSGTISIPGRDFNQPFSVSANDVTLITLPGFVETTGSEFIKNTAIQITALHDISVYMHQYFGMRSEASVVLPRSSLGDEYYVVSFTGVPPGVFGNDGIYPSQFLIVANEDETTISFTLTGDTQQGKDDGSTHSVTLDAGEVYQVRAVDWIEDFTGTYVTGDKDFSLFAGTSWSQVPLGCTAMDNLLEQMYPVSTWGTRYVASPFIATSNDLYRVIASENNTSISIEGETYEEISLNAGEYYDFFSGSGAFIEGSKPISVAQYITGSGCNGGVGDPSMVILNTVEQIRDTVTLYNSGFFAIDENYINVICKADEEDLIFFDNQNLVSQGILFNPIGNEGKFLYATVPTNIGAHTIYTRGCGIIAMAYGYGNVESYAYSGGASFTDINQNPIPEGGCLNDTIFFSSGLPPDRFRVTWDLGDGTVTQEHDFQHQYPDLGSYPLSLVIEDLCFDDIDTVLRDLKVTLRQDIFVIDDQEGCEGTTITLGAFDLDGAKFEWSGPKDFFSDQQFPNLQDIQLDDAGLYEVTGNISGCLTFPDVIAVTVHQNPQPFLGIDTVLCALDGDRILLNPGTFESYKWQEGSQRPEFEVRSPGIYSVSVTDEMNCVGTDSIYVDQQCPTRIYVPNIFSPNNDGINDVFEISGIEVITMELSIFDRWGQLVFHGHEEKDHWDGTLMNQEVMAGEYIWTLRFTGYREDASVYSDILHGSVMLVR